MFYSSKFFSGELAHALRFLASVVSQSFMAFDDILELHRKYLELSGGVNRIFELEELVDVAQKGASRLFFLQLFVYIIRSTIFFKDVGVFRFSIMFLGS